MDHCLTTFFFLISHCPIGIILCDQNNNPTVTNNAHLIARAAWSYARAASSAVSNVPSHRRAPTVGSRISAAHLPQGRCRTPLQRAPPVTGKSTQAGITPQLHLRPNGTIVCRTCKSCFCCCWLARRLPLAHQSPQCPDHLAHVEAPAQSVDGCNEYMILQIETCRHKKNHPNQLYRC